jgi:hypothetical protein
MKEEFRAISVVCALIGIPFILGLFGGVSMEEANSLAREMKVYVSCLEDKGNNCEENHKYFIKSIKIRE